MLNHPPCIFQTNIDAHKKLKMQMPREGTHQKVKEKYLQYNNNNSNKKGLSQGRASWLIFAIQIIC